MYMVMLVLDDPARLDDVLEAWEKVGVGGVTMFESTGLQRRRVLSRRVPLGLGLWSGTDDCLRGNYTLFTIVDDETVVQACLEAAEGVVGDLNEPRTGLLAAWPLLTSKGATLKPRSAE